MEKKSTKELAIKDTYNIQSPQAMSEMANVLKTHIVKHKLYSPIVGKNYVHVEGWQFAGGLMGLFPKVVSVTNLSSGSEIKWQSQVDIVEMKTGKIVGTGFAVCSNKESKKKSFDEYAVLSMAQTRAVGKAYRNLIGWVMKLAGYEGTPSEEMAKVGDVPPEVKTDGPVYVKEKVALKKGQIIGPDGDPTYICAVTGDPISDAEYEYSMKMFDTPLSRDAQKNYKPKKK